MSVEMKIEKSIEEQIIDKTIVKLTEYELFPDDVVQLLKEVDLTNKESVKKAISVVREEVE